MDVFEQWWAGIIMMAVIGTAAMSIVGGMAVVFCWWGVNYVLATGLHAYAVGKSSPWTPAVLVYYGTEIVFLLWAVWQWSQKRPK